MADEPKICKICGKPIVNKDGHCSIEISSPGRGSVGPFHDDCFDKKVKNLTKSIKGRF
jgi:hypothetical protein